MQQGAAQALHNPELKAVLLEADTPALQAVMAAAGFSRYLYDPFTRQLQPLSATSQAGSGHNQLWIRDLPFVCTAAAPRHPCRWGESHCGVGRGPCPLQQQRSHPPCPFLGPGLLSSLPIH